MLVLIPLLHSLSPPCRRNSQSRTQNSFLSRACLGCLQYKRDWLPSDDDGHELDETTKWNKVTELRSESVSHTAMWWHKGTWEKAAAVDLWWCSILQWGANLASLTSNTTSDEAGSLFSHFHQINGINKNISFGVWPEGPKLTIAMAWKTVPLRSRMLSPWINQWQVEKPAESSDKRLDQLIWSNVRWKDTLDNGYSHSTGGQG